MKNRSVIPRSHVCRVASQLLAVVALLSFLLAPTLYGAKVIMRDGKIYEGKIIAETDGDVLIRTSPVDRRPKLLLSAEILSVVRDPQTPEPRDPQRYTSLDIALNGDFFSSGPIALNPTARLELGGDLRFHPLMAIGAAVNWTPGVSGDLSVTGGSTVRGYQKFLRYGGGFRAKIYPLFSKFHHVEPFLIAGYQWSRLIPKDSGDSLRGRGFETGVGVQRAWREILFLQARFLYQRLTYDRIRFLEQLGSFDPEIDVNAYSFGIALGVRL